MEFAIEPTRLSLSVRITSLMKCEFTLRSRSETERRKFICNRLGASSRMCWKVGSSTVPSKRGLSGRGHGGARFPIEQRHFSKEISRLNKPERFLLTAPAGFGDFDGPFPDEIKQIARVAFAKNDLACVQLNEAHIGRNLIEQIGFDAFKEPILR